MPGDARLFIVLLGDSVEILSREILDELEENPSDYEEILRVIPVAPPNVPSETHQEAFEKLFALMETVDDQWIIKEGFEALLQSVRMKR